MHLLPLKYDILGVQECHFYNVSLIVVVNFNQKVIQSLFHYIEVVVITTCRIQEVGLYAQGP
jgi:hypothetical protein